MIELVFIGFLCCSIGSAYLGYKLGYRDGQLDPPRRTRGNYRPTHSIHPVSNY